MDRGRSVIWLCAGAGSTVGGVLPSLWGASDFSASSLVFGLVGGIAGVWLGIRLLDV